MMYFGMVCIQSQPARLLLGRIMPPVKGAAIPLNETNVLQSFTVSSHFSWWKEEGN